MFLNDQPAVVPLFEAACHAETHIDFIARLQRAGDAVAVRTEVNTSGGFGVKIEGF